MKKVLDIRIANLTAELNDLQPKTKYNRSRIFKRAMYLYKTKVLTWSEALKQSWSAAKTFVLKCRIELSGVKQKMLNLFTPEHYSNTTNYITNSMAQAEKLGLKIN